MYFSWLINNSEDSTEEEEKDGGDSLDTDFIYLSGF